MSSSPSSAAPPVAIVLAAGDGERMGGSKARLMIEGEPLALLHARRLREAGCSEVLVVTRPEVAARFASSPEASRLARFAPSAAADQAGSLEVALRAMAPPGDAVVIVTPVDALPARVETIAQLVAAVRAGLDAATPRRGGRGGHPVVARARALASEASHDPPLPLRDRLASLGVRRLRIDVDDDAIGTDLDTPEDVVHLTGAPPRFWG